MKNYFKAFIMLSFLNLGIQTLSMQEEDLDVIEGGQSIGPSNMTGGLPNELWMIILEFRYFDPYILAESKDIHEGLANLRANLSLCSKNLRLTCKTFNLISQGFHELKEELKQFYRVILKEKFLELRDDGLHPINAQWGISVGTNSRIGHFMLTRAELIDRPILVYLANIIENEKKEPSRFLRDKVFALLLFYDADMNLKTKKGSTALFSALFWHNTGNDNKDIIGMLLARGAEVNLQKKDGCTALIFTIAMHHDNINNNKDIIVKLLARGADVNLQAKDGNTALICAISHHDSSNRNNKDIMVMLLARGADVNLRKRDGYTALTLAVKMHGRLFDNEDIIALLLAHGADVNSQDNYYRNTPLITMIINRDRDKYQKIIAMLLAYGADINIQNNRGDTALTLANKYEFEDFDKLVKDYSPQKTLKNLCLRFILTHEELLAYELDFLPKELQDHFIFNSIN